MIISFNSNIWGADKYLHFLKKQTSRHIQQSTTALFSKSHRNRYIVKVVHSLCVSILNFLSTVSHDHFIQFQNLEAKILSTFYEENSHFSRISKAHQLHSHGCAAKDTV